LVTIDCKQGVLVSIIAGLGRHRSPVIPIPGLTESYGGGAVPVGVRVRRVTNAPPPGTRQRRSLHDKRSGR
jgi:hypothetical protein